MASVTAFLSYCKGLIIRNALENQEVVLKETQPDFPELIRESCNEVERLLQAESSPVNKWQCQHLQEKLNDVKSLGPEKVESGGLGLFKELYRIVKEAEDLIRRCCSQPWMRTAITQADNGEHFCELLHDLDWCIITISKQASSTGIQKRSRPRRGTKFKLQLAKSIAQNRSKNAEAARKDREELEARLQGAIQKGDDLQLANYLLSRLRNSKSSVDAKGERTKILGSGSYGIVYETSWLGEMYAEKVSNFEFAHKDDKVELLKKSFERESRALKSLRHPNVVQLVDYYCNDEMGSLLMSKEDKDLSKLVSTKGSPPFSLEVSLDILLQIARGLQYMHRLKMAHRDIKAKNILVSFEKYPSIFEAEGYVHVKLADFGMAKVKREPGCDQSTNPMTFGNRFGTFLWNAPELLNKTNVDKVVDAVAVDKTNVDHFAADIYSYGITCSEILTGLLPFSNADETVSPEGKDFFTRIAVDGDRPQLPTREDVCPPALAFLISMCWSTDPANRPNAAQIVRYLQDLKASLLVQAPFDHISWTWRFDPENVDDDDVSSSDGEGSTPDPPPTPKPAGVEDPEQETSPVPTLFERAKSYIPSLRRGPSIVPEVTRQVTVSTLDELEITSNEWETKKFPFKKLQAATNNFEICLGEGPFARIYRGKFSGKMEEAAVRHLRFATKADQKTFLENVAVMAAMKHDGLINLVGYCENEGEFYLVHEFIETPGTLGTVLLGYARSKELRVNRHVPWSQRYRIAVRVGEALAYLHAKDIVHGELTNRTIMLEEPNLNPRLFDFGMSYLFPQSTRSSKFVSIHNEFLQWLAPELKVRRKDSIKPSRESDMYNFGVLMLVLMGKRKVLINVPPDEPARKSKYIINEACILYEDGDVMNFLHERSIEEGSMTSESVMLCMHVALLCLQKDAWRRPTASEAVQMLQGEVAIPAEQLLNITDRIQQIEEKEPGIVV